jgi:hypothetical protein
MLSHCYASSTQLAVPTNPRARSARRASEGKNDGVAKGTAPSLSGVRCVSDTVFSQAAIPATTLPAVARRSVSTTAVGHQDGSVG